MSSAETYGSSDRPHLFEGLVPALLVVGLPRQPCETAATVGAPLGAFRPATGGALQADFDIPAGSSWRLWPDHGIAIWLGYGWRSAFPPVRHSWEQATTPLIDALRRLADEDLWLQEGCVLEHGGGWSDPTYGADVIDRMHVARAVAGTFSDVNARAVRGVVFDDGRVWAESAAEAERWLMIIAQLHR